MAVTNLDIIEQIKPLDGQVDSAKVLTVPEGLHDALFGQGLAGRMVPLDEGSGPPFLHTYAILDAAKVSSLPDMLDASGLDHICLFKGEAAGTLRHVAPWLVRLEDGNSFTRDLFTQAGGPQHLWHHHPGLVLRSSKDLQSIWTHFRKFIKLPDHTGRWYYVRFWEPATFETLTQIDRSFEHWLTRLLNGFQFVWPDVTMNGNTWFVFDMGAARDVAKEKLVIGPVAMEALDTAVRDRHEAEDILAVKAYFAASRLRLQASDPHLRSMRRWLSLRGFRQRRILVSAMQALAEKFPEGVSPPPDLMALLSDTRKGAGLRLWHIENWKETAQ